MKPKLFDILESMLADIELVTEYINVLYLIQRRLDRKLSVDKESREAYNRLVHMMYKEELDLWRNIGMIALVLDEEQLKKVREKAFNRFFKESKDISWIFDSMKTGDKICFKDQEELRNELKFRLLGDENGFN